MDLCIIFSLAFVLRQRFFGKSAIFFSLFKCSCFVDCFRCCKTKYRDFKPTSNSIPSAMQ